MKRPVEIALRVLLIATFLFNAVVPSMDVLASQQPNVPIGESAESPDKADAQSLWNFLKDFGGLFLEPSEKLQQSTNCPTSGDLVVANAETCSLNAGAYTFDSVVIQSGGTLRLISSDNGDTNYTNDYGVTLNVNSLTVEANGLITADGQGYAASKGPGVGAVGNWAGPQPGGSGHGGKGGDGNGPAGGSAYGSLYTPTDLGSGGRTNGSALGGPGGGAVRLVVDNLVVNGAISANGAAGAANQFETGGGGAGGSLWVRAGALSGSGEIRANGGQGQAVYGYSGGGAGGRIAIDVPVNNNTFTGLVKAYGGVGNQIGGAGTIYWTEENRVVANNNSQAGAETILLPGNYNLDRIEVKGKAKLRVLGVTSNITLTNTNLIGDGSGRLEVLGIVQAPENFTISGVMLAIANGLSGSTSITTQTNGGLELRADSPAFPGGVYHFDSVIVKSGSTLRLSSADNGDTNYTNDYGVTLNVNSLTVEANGLITADGQGYAASKGPGVGAVGNWAGPQPGGSGHGGKGGDGNGPVGGNAYGSLYTPTDLGSGGRTVGSGIGGTGGGAVRLMVANNLVVNGAISANGTDGTKAQFEAGGGASGGSLWVTAGALSGSGEIRANGGQGQAVYGYSGGGAGGRIAIDVPLDNNTFTGLVKAYGGVGSQIGGAGTIYWTAENRVVANNNSQAGAETILLAGNYNLDKIEVKGKANLRVLGANSNVTLSNTNLIGDGSGRLEVMGIAEAPENFTISGVMLAIENGLSGPTNITTQTNGGLELKAGSPAFPGGIYNFDSVAVKSGSILRLISSDNGDTNYTNDYGVTLNVDSLNVENNGLISADGVGYAAMKGPGLGAVGAWAGPQPGGSGYGGKGGNGAGPLGGKTYGSLYTPTDLGSGGQSNGGFAGGVGGGAVRLIVANSLVVNGIISANGANGAGGQFEAGAGGSGGSCWITAGELTGNGTIRANGGQGAAVQFGTAGGGGGGRIAVYSDNLASTIAITVSGGSGYQKGENGTIYLGSVDQTQSTLQISPSEVTVQDVNGAVVSVTLLNINGQPVQNAPVEIALASGSALSINHQSVGLNQYVSIGSTNQDGVVVGKLTSTIAGARTIQARSGQQLIGQTGTVRFLPGPVSTTISTITPTAQQSLANGTTAASVTVMALDAYENPIQGAQVSISASGHAMLAQPSGLSDRQGKFSVQVMDAVAETSTITATVNSQTLSKTATVQFVGTDIAVTLDAPSQAPIGSNIQYSLGVNNVGGFTADNLVVTLTLPDGVTYVSQTATIQPEQRGNILTWDLGNIDPGDQITFTVLERFRIR